MSMAFYHFYRLVALDGIVNFALLSYTIYMLCGARRRWLRGWLYVLLSTAAYFADDESPLTACLRPAVHHPLCAALLVLFPVQ